MGLDKGGNGLECDPVGRGSLDVDDLELVAVEKCEAVISKEVGLH